MNFTTRSISQLFLLIAFAVVSASSVFAQAIPDSAPISDQKPGSVLIFNYYGSDWSNPKGEDTQIHITNTHPQKAGMMAIFFISATTGATANAQVCLAPNQTVSFKTSDTDPGEKGYILAVSVDVTTGQPNYFNYFMGSASIKMLDGYRANLNAETISALIQTPGVANGDLWEATLKFDGVHYNKVPNILALDNIPAIADGDKTMVIVNQLGGSLPGNKRPDDLTGLTGIVYDAATKAYPWQEGNINSFQFRKVIADGFPNTMPSMSTVIPLQSFGWMKFWSTTRDKAMTGAVLYLNKGDDSGYGFPFIGGHNLHHMSLTTAELTIWAPPRKC
ncbi:MAG: hypothetical protein ACKVZH_12175 [Blastocatellia bacterium]